MAWYDPPLYKPGNKRCPRCGKYQWRPLLGAGLWARWNCPMCHTVLALDRLRFFISWLLWAAVLAMFLFVIPGPRPASALWIHVVAWLVLSVLIFEWGQSVRLKSIPERPSAEVDPKG